MRLIEVIKPSLKEKLMECSRNEADEVNVVESKSKEKFHFVGTCTNSFDEDGECMLPHFIDVTDFAQQEEQSVKIAKESFIASVDNLDVLPTGQYEYLMTESGNILMAYNVDSDIHYFYVK